MKIFIILPSRLESSRLKRKLLRKIGDYLLIEHMIFTAKKHKHATIIVASDSHDICKYATLHGVDHAFSRKSFNNGSERVYDAAKKYNAKENDIIINLQADEFNINYKIITKLINYLIKNPKHNIVTPAYLTKEKSEFMNKNYVKVIVNNENQAITFTRRPTSSIKNKYLIHMGVYAYRFKSLAKFVKLGVCNYEINESLEQLRLIWNNVPIYCLLTKKDNSIGINSLSDLIKARKIYEY